MMSENLGCLASSAYTRSELSPSKLFRPIRAPCRNGDRAFFMSAISSSVKTDSRIRYPSSLMMDAYFSVSIEMVSNSRVLRLQ